MASFWREKSLEEEIFSFFVVAVDKDVGRRRGFEVMEVKHKLEVDEEVNEDDELTI